MLHIQNIFVEIELFTGSKHLISDFVVNIVFPFFQ